MTMDRVYNTHQQHGFQQTHQSHRQPSPSLQLSSQQQQTNTPQTMHQPQQHLYRDNHRHLLLHHQHTHQTNNSSLNAPPPTLHRPVHPPPPPPPLPTQQQQVLTNRCIPVINASQTKDDLMSAATNVMRNSLPAVPTRSTNLASSELASRNSLQPNYYADTHYQYYQPSNLRTHSTHHHLDSVDNPKHHHQQQQVQLYHPTTNGPLQLPQHTNDSPVVIDNSVAIDNVSQDHYAEEVIQAILAAKEALEKPIEERDERDIMLIDNLCSLVHGFDAFPKSVRRALAAQAVLIVIDEKGKELIVHNEELDSFCVLIFGECEQLNVAKTMPIRYYTVGDAFGVCEPTTETIRFVGHMVTRCENCAFLCVKRDDFYTILTDPANYPNKEILRHRDRNGNVICVSQFNIEKKSCGPLWSYHMQSNPFKIVLPDGHVIIKAAEPYLLMALVDGYDRIDPEYVDDFLLLFRVFMTYDQKDKEKKLPPGMIRLCLTLAKWLDQVDYRDKVVKIVLTWLSSYYHDFELNSEFSYLFFRVLESRLLNLSMNNQLHLLHVTLSTKSKTRHVTISRSSREQPLSFSISGGYEKNCGIFVTQVNGSNCDDCPYDGLMNYLNFPSHLVDGGTRSTGPVIPPRHRGLNHHGLLGQQVDNSSRISAQLRPGDQILEVNGTNFSAIKLIEAQKKLDMSTHLSLTVKYNPSAFHEMRALPEGRRKSSLSSVSSVSPYPSGGQKFTFNLHDHHLHGNRNGNDQFPPISPLFSANANFGFRSIIKTAPKNDRLRLAHLINSSKQFVKQIRDSTTSNSNVETGSKTSDNASDDQSNEIDLGKSKSSSDLSNLRGKDKQIESGLSNVVRLDDLNPSSVAESQASGNSTNQTLVNVLRVFNAANNDFRYLPIHEETTAREVVMVAVKEFNLSANSASQASPGERTVSSLNWHLYEVSVVPESKTIKQKCLSEQTSRLAERASLCSRFYIKNNSHNSFGPSRLDMGDDALVNEILKESPPHVTLTSLNATLLAVELTLADFDKFRSIEPQQFVYDTFFVCSEKTQQNHSSNGSISSQETASLKSSSSDGQDSDVLHSLNKTRSVPKAWMQEYQQFADISNREMFWVICEILNERNIGRRVKIVKQFVRVADVCSQLRNYNSMFAIISGLGHSCVSRLRRTFEKLKPKYKNQLEKMRSLFDPSKNMSNYRMCLNQTQPPAIPLFPQIKKDLTFTKEGRSIFIRETNDLSDDDESGFSQGTIKRTDKSCAGGDLLSVKSATTLQNHGVDSGHHLPIAQTRSVSYTHFNNARTTNSDVGDSILVNFAEIRQFTERVRNVIYFSSIPYSNDLLTNTKDNQRTQAQIKKMHEEWQMRKRIRHYINQTLNDAIPDTQQQQVSTVCADRLDQTDGITGKQQQSGKINITYDERTLYQRSLEVEPELNQNARPQVVNEPRQLPQQSLHLPQPNHNHHHQQPQVPPTAVLMNMQPPPPLSSGANRSPTLSKSSSLSSCSSFSHHLPNYHVPRGSSNLNSSVGKFGTESSESLRKLRLLSENAADDCRSSYSSSNSRDNGLNRLTSGDRGGLAKNLISSRIFPPKGGGR